MERLLATLSPAAAKVVILYTNFLVFDTTFLVFNTKFIIFTHFRAQTTPSTTKLRPQQRISTSMSDVVKL